MADQRLSQGDALIVVDVQNDFCPGGRLPVPEGDRVIPVINRWIREARQAGVPVVASRDWHPRHHVSFQDEGGPWPEHCVQDTEGAQYHPTLELPDDAVKVSKGVRLDKDQYSAFDDTGLGDFLRKHQVEQVWVAGLAQDVCVHATVLAGCQENFRVHVIEDGTRPIDPEQGRRALEEMIASGATIES